MLNIWPLKLIFLVLLQNEEVSGGRDAIITRAKHMVCAIALIHMLDPIPMDVAAEDMGEDEVANGHRIRIPCIHSSEIGEVFISRARSV